MGAWSSVDPGRGLVWLGSFIYMTDGIDLGNIIKQLFFRHEISGSAGKYGQPKLLGPKTPVFRGSKPGDQVREKGKMCLVENQISAPSYRHGNKVASRGCWQLRTIS